MKATKLMQLCLKCDTHYIDVILPRRFFGLVPRKKIVPFGKARGQHISTLSGEKDVVRFSANELLLDIKKYAAAEQKIEEHGLLNCEVK